MVGQGSAPVLATLVVSRRAKYRCPHCGQHFVAVYQYCEHECKGHYRRADFRAALSGKRADELGELLFRRKLYAQHGVVDYEDEIDEIDNALDRIVRTAEIAERQGTRSSEKANEAWQDPESRTDECIAAVHHAQETLAAHIASREAAHDLLESDATHNRIRVTNAQRLAVYRRDNFTCQYCGAAPPEVEIHIEHRTPVVRGGTNELDNLCVACADCNLRKHTMTAEEFTAQEASS